MLKSIVRFMTPVLVLAATLGGGYLLLGLFQKADIEHEKMMNAAVTTNQATATSTAPAPSNSPYPWVLSYDPGTSIAARIPAPRGYERVGDLDPEGFANWLRNLPLKPPGTPVRLYNGQQKPNQLGHVGVVDIDVGTKDLQNCSNAVVRLRAEYLYSRQKYARIHFNLNNGTEAELTKWALGSRLTFENGQAQWTKPRPTAAKDYSYTSFHDFLETVFANSTSRSFSQELQPVSLVKLIGIGNVFCQTGDPGHAVIVVDMVENKKNGAKAFLLAQSYTPAQDIHILKNTRDKDAGIAPWFDVNFGPQLQTPDWKFNRGDLKRFK